MDLKRFVNDYEWVHTLVGICGNTLFFVGSVLFLSESTKSIGVWTFIVGSAFMLIGSIGSAMVQLSDDDDSDDGVSDRAASAADEPGRTLVQAGDGRLTVP